MKYLFRFTLIEYSSSQKKTYFFETMKQNVNKSEIITKMKNPVWKAKLGIYPPVLAYSQKPGKKTKPWKIKVILN